MNNLILNRSGKMKTYELLMEKQKKKKQNRCGRIRSVSDERERGGR